MNNNLFETLNEELYDVYAGGILYDLGYFIGKGVGYIAKNFYSAYQEYGWSDWIY